MPAHGVTEETRLIVTPAKAGVHVYPQEDATQRSIGTDMDASLRWHNVEITP